MPINRRRKRTSSHAGHCGFYDRRFVSRSAHVADRNGGAAAATADDEGRGRYLVFFFKWRTVSYCGEAGWHRGLDRLDAWEAGAMHGRQAGNVCR